MLTPQYLSKVPKQFEKMYLKLEEDIISEIARIIVKTGGNVTGSFEHQLYISELYGISIKEIEKRVAETLDKSLDEISGTIETAANISLEKDNAIYETAKLTPIHLHDNPLLEKYMYAAIDQTAGDFKNISGSLGFAVKKNGITIHKKLSNAYRDLLNEYNFLVTSGSMTADDATRKVVKELSDSGLRRINYMSGRSDHVDVAVRRALQTSVNQMCLHMTEVTSDELDLDLVEVTAHEGARPSHQVWQGKIYSRSGTSKKYPPLSVTGYGTVEGLGGANCRHSFNPYVEGTSKTWSKEQLKNVDNEPFKYKGMIYTHYEALQKQRQIERRMRKKKREIIALNSAGLQEDFEVASIKLRQIRAEYEAFSKAANLRKNMPRTQVYGYGRSISQRSARAAIRLNK